MAGTTSNYAFPYPTGTDSINTGDTKIQELADTLDAFISGSEATGKMFNYQGSEDTSTRTTTNCSSTPKNVASSTAGFTFTVGASGFFAVIVSGNANNTTTAANGWALGASVSGGGISSDVELSTDPSGITRNGGASIKFFDATAGATITLTPRIRTISPGGTDTVIVYQHKVAIVSFG